MTIKMIEGFDLYNGTQANIGFQAKWNTNVVAATTFPAGRFGGQCVRYNGSTGWYRRTLTGAARSTGSFGFACRVATLPTTTITRNIGVSASGQMLAGIVVLPSGAIQALRLNGATGAGGGTILGASAAGVIIQNVWHYIEWEWVISATVGRMTVKVDGVTVLNLTGVNTLTGANANADEWYLDNQGGSAVIDFDDLYEEDSGTSIGQRRVDTLRGTADTATKQWTPDTGTVNFSRVNANLAQQTTFVQASVVGNLDLYDIADLATTPATIDAVQYSVFAQKTDATARAIAAVGDIAGTQQQSGNFNMTVGVAKFESIFLTKPGGGAWAAADVNALRIGPKVTV